MLFNFEGDIKFIGRADEDNIRAYLFHKSICNFGIPFSRPTLCAAISRAGAERDERVIKDDALRREKIARLRFSSIRNIEGELWLEESGVQPHFLTQR